MAEEQSELEMHIENLRARAVDFKQSSQPLSTTDLADVTEEIATALTAVYAVLKSLPVK